MLVKIYNNGLYILTFEIKENRPIHNIFFHGYSQTQNRHSREGVHLVKVELRSKGVKGYIDGSRAVIV